jgi:carbon-monoxide dehydrogenase medium subunit
VIPAKFDYVRAGSAEEAISLLGQHGDEAKLLAGGHSLLPLMKLRLASPSVLVDIGRVSDLSYIRDGGDHVAVGALTRHRDLETSDLLKQQIPILAHTAGLVGDPQVRHRGTLGGTVAHGDPASDLPAVVLALGATLVVRGPDGERQIAATDFFRGFLETALEPDEMLTEIRLPKVAGAGWSYQKFNRRAQDWAIVGVAAVRNGTTGIALVNMGSTPVRATAVEQALAGPPISTPASSTAGIWPACSCGGRWRRPEPERGLNATRTGTGGSNRSFRPLGPASSGVRELQPGCSLPTHTTWAAAVGWRETDGRDADRRLPGRAATRDGG